MNIYIGNLSWDATDKDLKQAFEKFGEITRATVITDRFSGKSKGFGFVEMPDGDKAAEAIKEMDGKDLMGRSVRVNEAKPRTDSRERP